MRNDIFALFAAAVLAKANAPEILVYFRHDKEYGARFSASLFWDLTRDPEVFQILDAETGEILFDAA